MFSNTSNQDLCLLTTTSLTLSFIWGIGITLHSKLLRDSSIFYILYSSDTSVLSWLKNFHSQAPVSAQLPIPYDLASLGCGTEKYSVVLPLLQVFSYWLPVLIQETGWKLRRQVNLPYLTHSVKVSFFPVKRLIVYTITRNSALQETDILIP